MPAFAGQFVVFTKVVDKKTLNIILASVVSFFTTAIPLVFALPAPALSLLAALVLLILKVFAPRYCSLCTLPANPP